MAYGNQVGEAIALTGGCVICFLMRLACVFEAMPPTCNSAEKKAKKRKSDQKKADVLGHPGTVKYPTEENILHLPRLLILMLMEFWPAIEHYETKVCDGNVLLHGTSSWNHAQSQNSSKAISQVDVIS